jgi:hypothetical protein
VVTDTTLVTQPSAPARPAGIKEINCYIAGATVRIEGLPAAVCRRLARVLAPFVTPALEDAPTVRLQVRRRGRANWTLYVDDAETPAACGAFACLLPHVELQAISSALATSDVGAVFHGGALMLGDSTVLLVAPSGSGKTTLTLGLMGRGWEPYTDDAAVIDVSSLTLRTFPRCFHASPGVLALLPIAPQLEWIEGMAGYVRPREWAQVTKPPTTIVLVERDCTRPSTLVPVNRAEAAAALLNGAMRSAIPSASLAAVAARLAAQARQCVRLNNNELPTALDLIEGACRV